MGKKGFSFEFKAFKNKLGKIPLASAITIYGETDTGRSTLALKLVGELTSSELIGVYIDSTKHNNTKTYERFIKERDNLILMQMDKEEESIQILLELANSDAVDFIVIDTLSALPDLKGSSFYKSHLLVDLAAICDENEIMLIIVDNMKFNGIKHTFSCYKTLEMISNIIIKTNPLILREKEVTLNINFEKSDFQINNSTKHKISMKKWRE